ncbi:long-chain-fatty-acid--CoA ligase [Nocardioides nematodiphilus]|uniref:long-chain-fatty-acid--CoA ligase n=1 Tax=Nocardioides nematodiphilus TaxID=2849669 RepID=UPI001CD9EDE8|nr:long-chain-fatty-acid--CoA ligase [Nocardioides nematodiphilus]MCA1982070.1 long-chain-fatty-acid--CoA ligase [Nocardioides nematodiphilus]
MTPGTVRDLLLARAGDDRPGLLVEDAAWSWREIVTESAARTAALTSMLTPDRPPHVGVLLDNVPELAFLLGGAALGGQVVVGLNTTRRGPALAGDIARTDCQLVLTDAAHRDLLPEDVGVPVIDADSPEWEATLAGYQGTPAPAREATPGDLVMLIFTSGTSGEPKAVRVTDAKITIPGLMLADRFGLGPQDVVYVAMPMFHSNAIMAGWAVGLAAGATLALAPRFSASGFLPDVRRFGATYANYVGKPLSYVLATPERPDDADNPLRIVFGNEANEGDIADFARRFGCLVVDSYSSTENAVVVQRRPDMPPGSLGWPLDGVRVLDPETGRETPAARFDADGRLLNAATAIGELANTAGAGAFAGYYNDPAAEAERMRGGIYWSGDLAYRDAAGWIYFAGRSGEWLRVDGENMATAPIERILLRHPAVSEAAVYALPDHVGDKVATALVLRAPLSAEELWGFLAAQPDLSVKAWPSVVRVLETLPRTATNKVLKRSLRDLDAGLGTTWTR